MEFFGVTGSCVAIERWCKRYGLFREARDAMICLTGDVHQDSLMTNEQIFLREHGRDVSEVGVSVDYVRLCEKYDVKCTLYTTGRTLAEQWEQFRPIAESPLVEVGGHTFGGLPRSRLSRLWASLTGGISASHGHSHGSYARQKRDVKKMLDIARKRLGKDLLSWRSHGLVRDANTYKILAEMGIQYISDEVNWDKIMPERLEEGLISHPLNVLMDHDHIYHAHRTHEYVDRQKKSWRYDDDPTAESYTIEEWGEIVQEQVRVIEEQGGLATVLMHTLCMFVADEFATMERLLAVFAQSETIWASEVGQLLRSGNGGR